ncbi:MAG TPA: hypothetical protein VF337_04725 [Candidatus Limnocylindrales bacterium]
MDMQRPESDGEISKDGAWAERDFVRPLRPMKATPNPRLPVAVAISVAGIVLVSGLVLGAAVVHSSSGATPSASRIAAGDAAPTVSPTRPVSAAPTQDPPTSSPSIAASQGPTATPAIGELQLTAVVSPGHVKLTWSVLAGAISASYKVVRSSDDTVSWPLGADDILIAATDSKAIVMFTDSAGAGTFTYRVFAVTSAGNGDAVLAVSPARTVTV